MAAIPLEHISVKPGRFRREFKEEEIIALAESIMNVGQIHPLRVERVPESKDPVSGDWRYWIISGERRYRALCWLRDQGRVQELGPGISGPVQTAWCEPMFGHTELLAKEMELDENLRRVDLSWQEVAQATAELHELRTLVDSKWTVRQTADEIAAKGGPVNVTTTRNRILLAENLHRPELKGIDDENRAVRVLKKTLEQELVQALGAKLAAKASIHTIECTDALSGMRSIPDGTITCICTDPPYGIDAQDFNIHTAGASNSHHYDDSYTTVVALLRDVFVEAYRVARAEAHMYVFCDARHSHEWQELGRAAGWEPWPWPFIWVKNQGIASRPDFGPRHNYESILYFIKGGKRVYDVKSDVIIHPLDTERIHAAQKPVGVYVDLLRRSTIAGDKILDPFCGSGPIVGAALQLKLTAYAFDLDESSIAHTRLRAQASL